MAGWYIRRGEKIVGPADLPKLQELTADGKLLATDQLSRKIEGPWKKAGDTALFAIKQTQIAIIPPSPPPVVAEPTKKIVGSMTLHAIAKGGRSVAKGIAAYLRERAKRRHEIRIAKIQASASGKPALPAVVHPPIPITPTVSQATIIKVVNKNSAGGCGGCLGIILLAIIGGIAAIIIIGASPK